MLNKLMLWLKKIAGSLSLMELTRWASAVDQLKGMFHGCQFADNEEVKDMVHKNLLS
jgi:hypothetical protein